MRRASTFAIATGLLAALATIGSTARADVGTLYSLLTPPSSLQTGCFGPCECPVQLNPTYGSFELVPAGTDPLYANYEVRNYIASFNNGPGAVAITGSGRYRIGGEFALTQQLVLDLSVWGQPAQHFDSGIVPVSVPFPQIDLSSALHGFACHDSVIVVDARPIGTTGVPDAAHARVALTGASPNPFHAGIEISWTLPRAGPFDLAIVDLEGRRVRLLARVASPGPGSRSLTWDGRRDDGRVAPAGIYWVTLRSADGADRRRVVKIE
ncbi:MAG TPA: hypothetical protein VMJ70_06170 [Candidatus Sulfotelmatobacter sp.]|nr:hypothetical protein [Candidatus Sulfotelmatobacter sp.]